MTEDQQPGKDGKAELRGMKNNISRAALVIMLYLVLSLVFQYIILVSIGLAEGYRLSPSYASLIEVIARTRAGTLWARPAALLLSMLLAGFIALFVAVKRNRVVLSAFFSKPQTGADEITIIGVVNMGAYFMMAVLLVILQLVLKRFHIRLLTPDLTPPLGSPAGAAAMIIAAVILAPLMEEILFRGILLSALSRYGSFFAVICTSLLWAVGHGNILQSVPVFISGLFFGLLALKARSVLPTLILHMVINAFATTASLSKQFPSVLSSIFGVMLVLGFLTLIILAVVFICVYFKHFKLPPSLKMEYRRRACLAFFTSIPVLAVIVIGLTYIVIRIQFI